MKINVKAFNIKIKNVVTYSTVTIFRYVSVCFLYVRNPFHIWPQIIIIIGPYIMGSRFLGPLLALIILYSPSIGILRFVTVTSVNITTPPIFRVN